jgi:hypothetical protein
MKLVIVENPRPLTVEHYNDVANAPLSASLNSGYALAVARRTEWETAYLDFTTSNRNAAEVAAAILAEGGDIVLFHWVYSWGHEEFVRSIFDLLRRKSSVRLGAFGLFPTLSRSRLLKFAPQLDFILVGEFEDTLAELLPSFGELNRITALPGVARRDEEFVPRPQTADLSLLPAPDDVDANRSYPTLNIAASRGCYGKCSFCFIHRYYGCSRRRVRDTASLERELEIRLSRRDIKSLYFIDPTFIGQGTGERERVVEISRMAQRLGLPFGFETRVDGLDEELMAILAAHGATSVFLGIESGCDSVLRRIGKRINTEQIRRAVGIVRGNGIELNLGFIMFEPDSTLAELEENYAFLESLGLLAEHGQTANLLYHNQIVLNGSAAWERFEREGRLLLDDQLPFEARYRFRDPRVGAVCAAMGKITSRYFCAMDSARQLRPVSGEGCAAESGDLSSGDCDINALLKEAFLSLCRTAYTSSSAQIDQAGEKFLSQVTFCCSGSTPCGN